MRRLVGLNIETNEITGCKTRQSSSFELADVDEYVPAVVAPYLADTAFGIVVLNRANHAKLAFQGQVQRLDDFVCDLHCACARENGANRPPLYTPLEPKSITSAAKPSAYWCDARTSAAWIR